MDEVKPIRLIIADDHQIVLDGLKMVLKDQNDVEVLATFGDGEEVMQYLRTNREGVDVAILDIEMPHLNGIETTKKIKKNYPDVRVLVLTMYKKEGFISRILEAGADGYLLKNCGGEELLKAIRTVNTGENYLSNEVSRVIISSYKNPSQSQKTRLTRRETEVIKLIGAGKSAREISEALFIQSSTVETHRRNIIDKLGVANTLELVRYAVENGYV